MHHTHVTRGCTRARRHEENTQDHDSVLGSSNPAGVASRDVTNSMSTFTLPGVRCRSSGSVSDLPKPRATTAAVDRRSRRQHVKRSQHSHHHGTPPTTTAAEESDRVGRPNMLFGSFGAGAAETGAGTELLTADPTAATLLLARFGGTIDWRKLKLSESAPKRGEGIAVAVVLAVTVEVGATIARRWADRLRFPSLKLLARTTPVPLIPPGASASTMSSTSVRSSSAGHEQHKISKTCLHEVCKDKTRQDKTGQDRTSAYLHQRRRPSTMRTTKMSDESRLRQHLSACPRLLLLQLPPLPRGSRCRTAQQLVLVLVQPHRAVSIARSRSCQS